MFLSCLVHLGAGLSLGLVLLIDEISNKERQILWYAQIAPYCYQSHGNKFVFS